MAWLSFRTMLPKKWSVYYWRERRVFIAVLFSSSSLKLDVGFIMLTLNVMDYEFVELEIKVFS